MDETLAWQVGEPDLVSPEPGVVAHSSLIPALPWEDGRRRQKNPEP